MLESDAGCAASLEEARGLGLSGRVWCSAVAWGAAQAQSQTRGAKQKYFFTPPALQSPLLLVKGAHLNDAPRS